MCVLFSRRFSCSRQRFFLVGSESEVSVSYVVNTRVPTSIATMEEIDEILEGLPRDEGAHTRVLEWIERTAKDSTEELDDNQVAWNEQETG